MVPPKGRIGIGCCSARAATRMLRRSSAAVATSREGLAKIRLGRPAAATGPGTAIGVFSAEQFIIARFVGRTHKKENSYVK
jgi:hypothetical protein